MVHALAYSHSKPSTMYLATDTSQVWKSVDSGQTWCSINSGYYANGGRSLIIDPADENRVLAAGFVGPFYKKMSKKNIQRLQGIYRSTDGGANWKIVRKTGFYRHISKGRLFAFDTSSFSQKADMTEVVYAGSFNEGLLRSDNAGETWEVVDPELQGIVDMEENPLRPGELYVATESGLFRYNRGKTVVLGKGLPKSPTMIAVSGDREIVYAVCGTEKIYRSYNRGESFNPLSIGLHPFKINFQNIAVSHANSKFLYAKAHTSKYRMPFYSHDGGDSWKTSEMLVTFGEQLNEEFWFSGPIVPHPTNENIVFSVSNGKGRLFRSSNGGKEWSRLGTGFPGARILDIEFISKSRSLFGLTDFGLWASENNNETFKDLNVPRLFNQKTIPSFAAHSQIIVAFVGNYGKQGITVSRDFGKSWRTYPNKTGRNSRVYFDPENPDIVYAGKYRSDDAARTWIPLAHEIRVIHPMKGGVAFSYEDTEKKACLWYKTINNAKTWNALRSPAPFACKFVQDVALDPEKTDRIYAATSQGLWIHENGNWILKNDLNGITRDVFGTCFLSTVAVDPNAPEKVYVGKRAPGRGRSNGLFQSTDRGISWRSLSENAPFDVTVWSVNVSPFNGSVYMGTSMGTWVYNENGFDDNLSMFICP